MLEYFFNTIYQNIVTNGFDVAFDVYRVFLKSYVNPVLATLVAFGAICLIFIHLFKDGLSLKAIFVSNTSLISRFVLIVILINSLTLTNDVAKWFIGFFEAMSQSIFSVVSSGQNNDSLIITMSATIEAIDAIEFEDNFLGIKSIIVYLLSLFAGVFLIGKILVIKVITYILISLSPIAFSLWLFQVSKGITGSWLKLLISYNLQLVIMALIAAICLAPLFNQMNTEGQSIASFGTVVVTMLLFTYFLSLVNTITDGLISTIGTASGNFAGYAANMSAGAAGMARGALGILPKQHIERDLAMAGKGLGMVGKSAIAHMRKRIGG